MKTILQPNNYWPFGSPKLNIKKTKTFSTHFCTDKFANLSPMNSFLTKSTCFKFLGCGKFCNSHVNLMELVVMVAKLDYFESKEA